MIQILSHRGYWTDAAEKNAPVAFDRTIDANFGTETDVRDRDGALVVSHDPAGPDCELFSEVCLRFAGTGLPLAVNIKADGLAGLLGALLDGTDIDWFAFDMSLPEMIRYRRASLPYFTRHSDYEPAPALYAEAAGVWLDGFDGDWWSAATIAAHLDAGKRVCVVSPELHGRSHDQVWQRLRPLLPRPGLMLCTDLPHLAREVFADD